MSLEASVSKLGLTPYGEAGDPFDPTLHDALMHSYSADVTEPTAVQILQPGYKVGDRIIRPARVAVAEAAEDAAPAGGDRDSGPDSSSGPAGPDGPVTTPVTRPATTGWSVKFAPSRSSPDRRLIRCASAGDCAAGK